MKENEIRLAGICYESLANGPGFRRVYFSQGCTHNCKGCFNPDTHDFNGGQIMNMNTLVEDIKQTSFVNVTFSGGDPFQQAGPFSRFAIKLKECKKNIWCFTGYTFEELLEKSKTDSDIKTLLENIDVLIDGEFKEGFYKDGLKFRGSTNQRIINVPKSLDYHKAIMIEKYMTT